MKVLALNCSPKMEKSLTALILNPFLEGMTEAGAEVELFYTHKLKINACYGCLRCWINTPGECFQKDDMQILYPKLREADVWVFSTPIQCDGMTGSMKNLMDRGFLPLTKAFYEIRDGRCSLPLREGTKSGRAVLVSSCGFYEMETFDPTLAHMKGFCRTLSREFAGALLRPYASRLPGLMARGVPVGDVLEAAKDAGRQLVEDGEMSAETLSTISREIMPREEFVQAVNENFQESIDVLKGKSLGFWEYRYMPPEERSKWLKTQVQAKSK